MGEYADEQIERDMRAAARAHGVEVDDDSQVGFFRAQKELVAQWWPSSGKTMDGQRKGQHCTTGKALVSWLRAKQVSRG